GTRIRTWVLGVRVRCPTARRSPSGRSAYPVSPRGCHRTGGETDGAVRARASRAGPREPHATTRDAAGETRRRRRASESALRELRRPARLAQADLLALDLARVARDEAGTAQRLAQRLVVRHQRPRDAVTD